jgi:hypothetical protein
VGLEEKVLEVSKRALGEEHPDTLLSMGNLAASYSDLGRLQDAVELEEKVLEARKRMLGKEHPRTLLSINNLEIYLTNLSEQTHPQNLVLRPALQSKEQVEGKSRSRWSLKPLFKRNY